MKKILIADHDPSITFTLKKLLQAESYEVHSCYDCKHLLQLAGLQNFDLIFVNSKMTIAGGSDSVSSLQIIQPSAAFIIIHDIDAPEPLNLPPVFDQIQKPIDFHTIIKRIEELFNNKESALTNFDISLADYIRILAAKKMTHALLVRKNRKQGIILVQDGDVVYADTAELKGEMAFHEILSWSEGRVKKIKVKKYPNPNINKNTNHLLLTANHFVDKKSLKEEPEPELPKREPTVEPSDQPEAELTENNTHSEQNQGIQARAFLHRHFRKSTAVVVILLAGLFLFVQSEIKNEVKAGKPPSHLVQEAAGKFYRLSGKNKKKIASEGEYVEQQDRVDETEQ